MKKKSLVMLLSVVLVVATVAMGTVAYLTDRTSITNIFTVGNVNIKVDEAVVNQDGEPVKEEEDGTEKVVDRVYADRTEEGNEYHLVPGKTYTKDPTVTVEANSEKSYVRMLVRITDIADLKKALDIPETQILLPGDYVEGYDGEKWNYVEKDIDSIELPEGETKVALYEFRYFEPVDTMDGQAKVLEPLFTSFTLPGDKVTGEELQTLDTLEITVFGQAIQTATFTASADGTQIAEDAAWAAFDIQNSANN